MDFLFPNEIPGADKPGDIFSSFLPAAMDLPGRQAEKFQSSLCNQVYASMRFKGKQDCICVKYI